jgi:hypothetical protein
MKLIATGLVKEVKAKAGTPVWRRDEQDGQSYALKLTVAGAKAIAVNPDDNEEPAEGKQRPEIELDRPLPLAHPGGSDAGTMGCARGALDRGVPSGRHEQHHH